LKVADLYKQHLDKQRQKMMVARDKTQANLRVALNTYNTVKVSSELVNLLRSSSKSFDDLLSIQVPDLLVFQNAQMKEEFTALTAKLKE
jgi:hydroxypyruvate isomerase